MKRSLRVPELVQAKRARKARRKQRRVEMAHDRYDDFMREVCEPIDIYGTATRG